MISFEGVVFIIILGLIFVSTAGISIAIKSQTYELRAAIEEVQSDFRVAQFKSCFLSFKDVPICIRYAELTEEDIERLE